MRQISGHMCGVPHVTLWLTFHILHDHAQVAPRFKGAVHADDKRVFCKCQDIPFHESLLDLVSKDEVLLVNLLHGKPLPGFLMPNKVDCPAKEHKCWDSQREEVRRSWDAVHHLISNCFEVQASAGIQLTPLVTAVQAKILRLNWLKQFFHIRSQIMHKASTSSSLPTAGNGPCPAWALFKS